MKLIINNHNKEQIHLLPVLSGQCSLLTAHLHTHPAGQRRCTHIEYSFRAHCLGVFYRILYVFNPQPFTFVSNYP